MNKNNKLDVPSFLSEEMKKVLAFQEEMSKDAFSTEGLSYQEIRENYIKERKYWNEGGPEMEEVSDISVPTRHGNVSVRLNYYGAQASYPCIFFIHGGGMVVGNNDTHNRIMRMLAKYSEAVVAGIDYSLSPEAKFPQALEECADVVLYLMKHADQHKINADVLAFAGDSGGANLSMGSYLYLRDKGESISPFRAMLLYYGMYGLEDSISRRLLGGSWDGLAEEDLRFYEKMYLGDLHKSKSLYYNILESDLGDRIPPCFIVASDMDPLLDDSKVLHEVLKMKNVTSEYVEYQGALHGFLHYSKMMKDAQDALQKGGDFFKRQWKNRG